MSVLEIVESPERAGVLLDETRLRLVRELAEPDSAAGVARRLNLPRQRVNYHLRELEKAGFLKLVEERRKGNCTERLVRATARSYLVSPGAMGPIEPDPASMRDRFSLPYLVGVAARMISDLATLKRRAAKTGRTVSTLTLQVDVRFASSADRDAFGEDVAGEIARLVREYHNDSDPDGRVHRMMIGVYPAVTEDEDGRSLSPEEADLSLGELR
jgi:DNA-binding transcriptional ArsR family regulator